MKSKMICFFMFVILLVPQICHAEKLRVVPCTDKVSDMYRYCLDGIKTVKNQEDIEVILSQRDDKSRVKEKRTVILKAENKHFEYILLSLTSSLLKYRSTLAKLEWKKNKASISYHLRSNLLMNLEVNDKNIVESFAFDTMLWLKDE